MPQEAESTMILWMLECRTTSSFHELIPIYATTREEAEKKAQEWIVQTPRAMTFVALKPFPRGFTIHHSRLPGRL